MANATNPAKSIPAKTTPARTNPANPANTDNKANSVHKADVMDNNDRLAKDKANQATANATATVKATSGGRMIPATKPPMTTAAMVLKVRIFTRVFDMSFAAALLRAVPNAGLRESASRNAITPPEKGGAQISSGGARKGLMFRYAEAYGAGQQEFA